jgi:mycothiol synthase
LAKLDGYDLGRQMVIEKAGQLVHAGCFVPNEGGATFIFLSSPDRLSRERESLAPYCREMLHELVRWSFSEGAKLLQVLIEIEDQSRQELCLACGFSSLTNLIYLYRSRQPSPLVIDPPKNIRWVQYDHSTHELFKQVIAQTYQDSLDCPELENMRDMEDVICAHKASGEFDRMLWNVLLMNDQPAGVLLLSPLRNSDMMELTYMGLGREYRGQKLGLFLLSKAMRDMDQSALAGLTLAVDQRNHPAHQIYLRFGFTELFKRSVLICTSPVV